MTLKKSDMIDLLNSEIGISKSEARTLIEDLFKILTTTLESGRAVALMGFGTFKTLDKTERVGRNPRTGQLHLVTARRVVTFKGSKKLLHKIKETSNLSSKEKALKTELYDWDSVLSELKPNHQRKA